MQVPIEVVGSSKYGVDPKINVERTYNLFISDGWLVNCPGFKRISNAISGDEGRGLFYSLRGGFLIVVVDSLVYRVNSALGAKLIGQLNTRFGEVYIDENLTSQICIVDGNNAWIYNYDSGDFQKQTLNVGFDLTPGYVCYHNSFFLIAPSVNDANNNYTWYAFQRATDSTISLVTNSSFSIQTKPDVCLAVRRLPGKSNHVLVIGSSVCEVYTQVGGEENYRRNSSYNIDYGCISPSTIAASDEFLCFLAQNENNEPAILVTDGAQTSFISSDGIDNMLQNIVEPQLSTAFFYRQDGHLFYQLTFFGERDNKSLLYDFKTKMFFDVTDENMNYHPARQTAYFNKKTVFVGLTRGSLFEMSTSLNGVYYDENQETGYTIPRIRYTNTFRMPDGRPFFNKAFQFWLEQGYESYPALFEGVNEFCTNFMITEDGQIMITEGGQTMLAEDGYCVNFVPKPRVDLSFSKNGNASFSNIVGKDLNPQGVHRNRLPWHRLGFANEITFKIAFYGLSRFVANNGILEVDA